MKKTQIFIGPNGTHKTKLLTNIFKNKKEIKNNNVLFIGAEIILNKDLELGREESVMEFQKFLENFYLYELKYEKLEKNKWQNFKKNKEKLNSEISSLFGDSDDNVIKAMKCVIKITEEIPKFNKIKFVELNRYGGWRIKETIGGTGQRFYTFLKLVLIFCRLSKENNAENTYLLIDEPEKFCHPSLILEISYLLKEISKKINLYIVSHSALFINNFIDKENRNDVELFRALSMKELDENELLKYRKKNNKFFQKIKLSILQGKKELLNYPIFSFNVYESLFAKKIILVEGVADEMTIKMLINEIKINKREKNVFIFKTLGKKAMRWCIKWLINNKINDFFVIFDQDTKNESLNVKILNLIKNNYFYFEKDIETSFGVKKNSKSFPEWIFDEEEMKRIKTTPKYNELKKKITDFIKKDKNTV